MKKSQDIPQFLYIKTYYCLFLKLHVKLRKIIIAAFKMVNIEQINRYIIVSIFGYCLVLISMFLLVDILKMNKTTSFLSVYVIAYISVYFLNLNYVFMKSHNLRISLIYILNLLFFLGIGSVAFKFLNSCNLHYLLSTFLTSISLMFFKFLTYRYIVYR